MAFPQDGGLPGLRLKPPGTQSAKTKAAEDCSHPKTQAQPLAEGFGECGQSSAAFPFPRVPALDALNRTRSPRSRPVVAFGLRRDLWLGLSAARPCTRKGLRLPYKHGWRKPCLRPRQGYSCLTGECPIANIVF